MPKVLVDATPCLYTSSGVGRVTENLLRHMVELDECPELTLYSRSLKKSISNFDQCRKYHVKLPEKLEWIISLSNMIKRKNKDCQLFHATDHAMPIKYPGKTLATVHDLIFLKSPEAHMSKIHAKMTKTVPPYVKQCKHIISCSEYTKNDLIEIMGIPADKITVIPWGIDQTLFSTPENIDEIKEALKQELNIDFPYFLGVSCSTGRKNTPMLLEAYSKLLEKNPDNHLVLVWAPPEDIKEKYRHTNIHFTGKVSDAALRMLYQAATATVYPSKYEGFGLPVLESMKCGTPVICSNVTSLPEVGGDIAKYIDPENCESLVAELSNFDNGKYDFEKLRIDGIAHAEKFSWEECARKTIKVYERCINE